MYWLKSLFNLILEVAYSKYTIVGMFSYIFGVLSAFFTAFYSGRLLFLTFGGKNNSFRYNLIKIHEGDILACCPLLILVIGSIFSGYFFKDIFIGFGSIFFDNAITTLAINSLNFDPEFLPIHIKLIPTGFSLCGLTISFFTSFSISNTIPPWWAIKLYIFLNYKWFIDQIYNNYIGNFILFYAYKFCYKIIDKGLLEYFGPEILNTVIYKTSKYSLKFQTGVIYHYISLIFLTLLFFFIYFELKYL